MTAFYQNDDVSPRQILYINDLTERSIFKNFIDIMFKGDEYSGCWADDGVSSIIWLHGKSRFFVLDEERVKREDITSAIESLGIELVFVHCDSRNGLDFHKCLINNHLIPHGAEII